LTSFLFLSQFYTTRATSSPSDESCKSGNQGFAREVAD
jgi:hypothetical protein